MNEKTIMLFSAELQKETPHVVDVDPSGEVTLTCTETKRTLKLPKGTTAQAIKAFTEKHKKMNEGQLSTKALDEAKNKLMKDLLN